MIENERKLALRALTEFDFDRRMIGGSEISDERLIQNIFGTKDNRRAKLLSSSSKLLRLMGALISRRKSPEAFVDKFSEQFLSIEDWESDEIIDQLFDEMNEYYGKIQFFSQSPKERAEEPLLFGEEELIRITEVPFERFRRAFIISIEKVT